MLFQCSNGTMNLQDICMHLLIFTFTNHVAAHTHRSRWLNICKTAFHQLLANVPCVCSTVTGFSAHSVWEQSGLSETKPLVETISTCLNSARKVGWLFSPSLDFQRWPQSWFQVFVSKRAKRETCTAVVTVVSYFMTWLDKQYAD